MKRRFLCALALAALFCGIPRVQADPAIPAIDLTGMQKQFQFGPASITVRGQDVGVAYCAPDVPYVEWYVGRREHDPRLSDYDARMKDFTRRAIMTKTGDRVCENLSSGKYVVWAFSHVSRSQPSKMECVQSPPTENGAGQISNMRIQQCFGGDGESVMSLRSLWLGERQVELTAQSAQVSY